jgi:NAD(P) transhydrogenase subunit beta
MSASVTAFLYLVAGVLFILALRGLSHPVTSRQGNRFGMAGMAIAVLTTLFGSPPDDWLGWLLLVVALGAGGAVGAVIARRIPMTAMPQLVAAFHSLVGLAAVLVAAAALYAPQAFGIGRQGEIHGASLVEMSIGVAIGALTFTGSIIAFLKLDARMSGKPILLPSRHLLNIALGSLLVALIVLFTATESHLAFWAIVLVSLGPRRHHDRPDRRRRHAGRRVDAELLFRLGGGGIGFTLGNTALIITGRAGRLVGRDPLLHHVQGDEPLVRLRHPRRLRRRDGGAGR